MQTLETILSACVAAVNQPIATTELLPSEPQSAPVVVFPFQMFPEAAPVQ